MHVLAFKTADSASSQTKLAETKDSTEQRREYDYRVKSGKTCGCLLSLEEDTPPGGETPPKVLMCPGSLT